MKESGRKRAVRCDQRGNVKCAKKKSFPDKWHERYKAGQRERKRERAQHSGIKEGGKGENKMTQHGWLAS